MQTQSTDRKGYKRTLEDYIIVFTRISVWPDNEFCCVRVCVYMYCYIVYKVYVRYVHCYVIILEEDEQNTQKKFKV